MQVNCRMSSSFIFSDVSFLVLFVFMTRLNWIYRWSACSSYHILPYLAYIHKSSLDMFISITCLRWWLPPYVWSCSVWFLPTFMYGGQFPLTYKKFYSYELKFLRTLLLRTLWGWYIWISSNEMDETGAYYTEWSKPERKTPIQYTNAYIWNLERW